MKVFVIVVTYNPKKEWIDNCLGSLRQSSCFVQTIIVDNNSTDGAKEHICKNFPEVLLIESTLNLGFGQANNIGIKKAYNDGADYFFLLNQDAWIEDDTIEKLIKAHNTEEQFGILSPMHLNGNGDALDYNFSNFIRPSKCKKIFSDIFLHKSKDKIYKTEFVNAAAWLISRECVEKVGGFSPSFFHYGEDNNYSQRVRYHKLSIGVFPDAKIYHDREDRIENFSFDNEFASYQRHIIIKASSVFYDFSFKREYLYCYIELFKSILRLRLKNSSYPLLKIKVLNSIDKKQVVKNKLISKVSQKSFL